MNTPESIKMGRSRTLSSRCNYAVLQLLQKEGSLALSEIKKRIPEMVAFDDWELGISDKTGRPRWLTMMLYYSIDLKVAKLLLKDNGIWSITDEGRKALQKYKTPEKLYAYTHKAYNDYIKNKMQTDAPDDIEPMSPTLNFEDIQSQADEDIHSYISEMPSLEFQNIVASLLRAMGFYTPFVAPAGKDGGIDIVAYSDPMGTGTILKVQVKRYEKDHTVGSPDIQKLVGASDGAIPVFVTASDFSNDARNYARQKNVRLINGKELVNLWILYYDKMCADDKARMPIEPIYFVRREE